MYHDHASTAHLATKDPKRDSDEFEPLLTGTLQEPSAGVSTGVLDVTGPLKRIYAAVQRSGSSLRRATVGPK